MPTRSRLDRMLILIMQMRLSGNTARSAGGPSPQPRLVHLALKRRTLERNECHESTHKVNVKT